MLRFAASFFTAGVLGALLVGWRGWASPPPTGRLLPAALAVGVGLGVSSCAFIIWTWVGGDPAAFPLAESGTLLVLGGLALWRFRRSAGYGGVTGTQPPRLLGLALGVSAALAVAAFVVEARANPHGSWDAWMTWNMHARAIVRGGVRWHDVLSALPAWSHPDYPLLVPASVARVWTWLGRENPAGPAAVGFLFTFAAAGLLYAAVGALRSPSQGALAALLLLGTKFFILQGASQYADIPVGFFFLATLALLALAEARPEDRARLLRLAGLTAGLAAWSKNEGVLFVLVVAVMWLAAAGRVRGAREAWKDAGAAAMGLAPVLALVLAFKLSMAVPNDLMADQGLARTTARMLDSGRYAQIFVGFVQAVLEVGARGLVPLLLAGYALAAGLTPSGSARRGGWMAAGVVAIMLAGYAAVLLVAPAPRLETNIRSVNRLLLQFWPSMLLAYFLLVRTVEEACGTGLRAGVPLEPA